MLYSLPRSVLAVAAAVGLMACSDSTGVELPVGVIEHVITESVVADVGESIGDAETRVLVEVPDATFVTELESYLDAMNQHIANLDVLAAERSLLQARALLARPGLSVEVQDSASDLGAVALILDQTQALIDAALGREV
jgi:hypothetical protein